MRASSTHLPGYLAITTTFLAAYGAVVRTEILAFRRKLMSANQSNGKAKNKVGRPTKATPARIKSILDDLALGLTEAQACAYNDVHFTTWIDWKNDTEKYPELRDKAQARRIKVLQKRKQEAMEQKLDWKEPAWDLERIFPNQFADPAKVALHLNQQIHGNRDPRIWTQEELEQS
jgi:hypothetical protein